MGEGLALPRTLAYDAYNYILYEAPNATTFITNLDQRGLDTTIREPATNVTVLAPPDFSWEGADISEEMLDNVLQNHIFQGLLFSDQLREMDGATITSINGKQWTISNIDGNIELVSMTVDINVAITSSDNLVRNGIVHLLGGLLMDSPDNTTQNCSACSGPINLNSSLPDGLSCRLWQLEVSQLAADAEACALEQAVGIEYCGCSAPDEVQPCNSCPNGALAFNPERILPDTRGLTCEDLSTLRFVECSIIYEKYSFWCGCVDAQAEAPNCTLCDGGGSFQNKPYIVPGQDSATFSYQMFGQLANTSCQGFADFYSVQTRQSCEGAGEQLTGDTFVDIQAWCQCPGTSAPNVCGEFCPRGTILQEALVPNNETEYTCREISDIFAYSQDNSTCESARVPWRSCCIMDPLIVNASFVVANEKGLNSTQLASPVYGNTLNAAYAAFAEALVQESGGSLGRRHLRQPSFPGRASRQLLVTYQAESANIYAVQTVTCQPYNNITSASTCHNVLARFNLLVEDEDTEAVRERYKAAAKSAILDRKLLQQRIDSLDSSYPFRVVGVLDENQTAQDREQGSGSDDGDGKMTWWLILFIVFACVSGCGGLLCLALYFVAANQAAKSVGDDTEADPLAERLLDNQDDKDPEELSPDTNKDSDNESDAWEDEERSPDAKVDQDDASDDWEDASAVVVEELSVRSDRQMDEAANVGEAPVPVPGPVDVEEDDADESDEIWEETPPFGLLKGSDDDSDSDWGEEQEQQPLLLEESRNVAQDGQDAGSAGVEDAPAEELPKQAVGEDDAGEDGAAPEMHDQPTPEPPEAEAEVQDRNLTQPVAGEGSLKEDNPVPEKDDSLEAESPQAEEAAQDEEPEAQAEGNGSDDQEDISGMAPGLVLAGAAGAAAAANLGEMGEESQRFEEDSQVRRMKPIDPNSSIPREIAVADEQDWSVDGKVTEAAQQVSDNLDAEIAGINKENEPATDDYKETTSINSEGDIDDQEAIQKLQAELANIEQYVVQNPLELESLIDEGAEGEDDNNHAREPSERLLDDGSDEKLDQWDDEDITQEMKLEQTANTGILLGMEHASNMNKLEQIEVQKQQEEIIQHWPPTDDEGDDDDNVNWEDSDDNDEGWDDEDQPQPPAAPSGQVGVQGPIDPQQEVASAGEPFSTNDFDEAASDEWEDE